MRKNFRVLIITLILIIIPVFTSSCGLSSFFVALNDFAFEISGLKETEIIEESTENNSQTTTIIETTTEETTIEETTTQAEEETVLIKESENVEIEDTPAPAVDESSSVSDISKPAEYTEEDAQAAKDVTDDLNISDPYAAVKYYHDWIASNTYYTEDLQYNDADGVFSYGKSACLGYSLAFKALIDEWSESHPEAGVECKIAYGDDDTSTPNVGHAWNIVKIYGAWYHVDVTWDDWDNYSLIVYDYFLMPDAVMNQSRVTYYVGSLESAPSCTSTAYTFGIKDNGVSVTHVLNDFNEFSDSYLDIIISGSTSATFYYSSTEDINTLSISNAVWNELVNQGFSSVEIRINNYTMYSNDAYTDYYFFTIYPRN